MTDSVFSGPVSARGVRSSGRMTTRDDVTNGTDRIVGGRAFSSVADSSPAVGNGAWRVFDVYYNVPPETMQSGSTLSVHGSVRRTSNAGADTAQVAISVGGWSFMLSPAVSSANGDRCIFDMTLTSRGAPGAAVDVVGGGTVGWTTGGAAPVSVGAIYTLDTLSAMSVVVSISMAANVLNTAVLEQLVVFIT